MRKEVQRLRVLVHRERNEKSDLEEQLDESSSAREILEDENATLRKMLREAREMLMTDKRDGLDDNNSTNTLALQKRVRRWRTSRRSQQPVFKQNAVSSNIVEQKILGTFEPPKPPTNTFQEENLASQLREEERRGREKADRLARARLIEEERKRREEDERRKREEEAAKRREDFEREEEERKRLEEVRKKEEELKRKEEELKKKEEEAKRMERERLDAEEKKRKEEEELKKKEEEAQRMEREREVEAFMKQEAEKELVDTEDKEEEEEKEVKDDTDKIDPVLAEHQRRARERFEERMREQARENESATTTDDDDNSYGSGSFSAGGGSFEDDDDEDTDDGGGFFKTQF